MNFVFEALIVLILVGGAYAGIRLGFVKISSIPLKTFLPLFFAFSFCSVIGKGIIAPIIQTPLTNYIKSFIYVNCSGLSPQNVVAEMPTLLKMSGADFNVDLNSSVEMTTDAAVGSVVYNFTSPFINVIAIGFSFVILFFAGRLIITLGILLVQRFCHSGVIAVINKAMGFVLAGFLSILGAWSFVGVTEFVLHLPMFESFYATYEFSGGPLYQLFCSITPLELLLSF